MTRTNGVLGDWTFDGLAWGARALGGVAPVRRALADRIERRMRSRADRPAAELRHPPAVEQDKAALSLALLQVAERGLAERRLGRAGAAGAAEDPLHRRPRAPRRREREGPLPRAPPGRDAARLPRHQPGQGLQPRLRGLLRELRRARREARLGHGRPHRPRRPRRLGRALLRAHGRRAARLAREPQGRPRARRAPPRLLLHHVLERDPDRRRAGAAAWASSAT